MGSITINKDLLRERQSCTFNVLELTHLWDGGPEKTKERKELGKSVILTAISSSTERYVDEILGAVELNATLHVQSYLHIQCR